MNTLDTLLSQEFIYRFGWTLVHFVWQGLVIALTISLVLWFLKTKSSNGRYLVGCLGLIMMAVMPIITFISLNQGEVITSNNIFIEEPLISSTTIPEVTSETLVESVPVDITSTHDSVYLPPIEKSELNLSEAVVPFLPWLSLCWFVGVCLLSVRLLGGWLGIIRIKKNREPLGEITLQEKFKSLVEVMKITSSVKIFQSTLVRVPMVIGWLKP